MDIDPAEELGSDRSHPARVWNYWLGGTDNYPADRAVADAGAEVNPGLPLMARQCRRFLVRSVRYLAGEAGIRQFLDIGAGLPTMRNTHEVAQAVAPDSMIVYVDNDPLVLAHARDLLTNTTDEGVTTYLHADVRDPEPLLDDARNVLNFDRPVAVMLLGILGHAAPEYDTMRSLISRLMAATCPGSHLVLVDGVETDDQTYLAGVERLHEVGHMYQLRTVGQFRACFAGMELVAPGLVPVTRWRPDDDEEGADAPCSVYGAVGVRR